MTKQGPLRGNMQPQTRDVFIQQGFIYINASSAIGIHGSCGVFVFTHIFRSVRRGKKVKFKCNDIAEGAVLKFCI